MRIAIFARYSSRLQDELTLEAQVSEMETYCTQHNWTVTHRYLLPETRSADVDTSLEFQAMMEAAKGRQFDLLLVHKLDRFGRSREMAVLNKARLRKMGVQVRSVVEDLGESIMERAMEGMVEVMSEWYALNLGQETRKGQAQLTRLGFWRGSTVPWGLRTVPVQHGGRDYNRLESDPTRGPIMREVFERVAGGERTGGVLAWVKETTGEHWSSEAFYTRIRNPVYYGLIEFGRSKMEAGRKRQKGDPAAAVTGHWEGLVPREVWDAANAQVRSRARSHAHKRSPRRLYLLTEGVATCARCGRPLVGSNFFNRPRYVCSGRTHRLCDDRHTQYAEQLEEAVHRLFMQAVADLNVEVLVENYRRSQVPRLENAKTREAGLRKQLTEVRRKLKNLAAALADGIDAASVRDLMRQLQAEEGQLAQEIATCQLASDQAVGQSVEILRSYLGSLVKDVADATPDELKAIYQTVMTLRWDLEKKEGQFALALSEPLALSVDGSRKSRGRSGPTTGFTQRGVLTVQPYSVEFAFV